MKFNGIVATVHKPTEKDGGTPLFYYSPSALSWGRENPCRYLSSYCST
uniref:Uncharacterized protein n=1 Tax=Romanomermis culicivorax TaxID=13658 RepID=A0A915L1X7_ROMCU